MDFADELDISRRTQPAWFQDNRDVIQVATKLLQSGDTDVTRKDDPDQPPRSMCQVIDECKSRWMKELVESSIGAAGHSSGPKLLTAELGPNVSIQISGQSANKRDGIPNTRMSDEMHTNLSYPVMTCPRNGQDSFSISIGENSLVCAVADGHGTNPAGTEFARWSSEMGCKYVMRDLDIIKQLVADNETDRLNHMMNQLFDDLDKYLTNVHPPTKGKLGGGCTLTVSMWFLHPETKKLVSITTNAGDSPTHMCNAEDGSVTEVTVDLNCDTTEGIQMYLTDCFQNDVLPYQIFLGRFNYKGPGGRRTPWMGNYKPIKPYKEQDMREGKLVLDQEVVERFYTQATCPGFQQCFQQGGSQSIRGRTQNVEAMLDGRFPVTNFGNTWGTDERPCRGQYLSSIGDPDSQLRMLTHTHLTEGM